MMPCLTGKALFLVATSLLVRALPQNSFEPRAEAGRRNVTNPIPAPVVSKQWSYYGCYNDHTDDRTIFSDFYSDGKGMTNEACASYCSAKGYTVFGTEYARECYCGYSLKTIRSASYPDSSCNLPCTGNSTEPCGGADFLTVYRSSTPSPQIQQDSHGYQYLGCYTDDPNHRALAHPVHNSQSSRTMTVDICTNLCSAAGYGLAGLEYGGECYCDNVLASPSSLRTGDATYSGCSISCNGDQHTWCGGRSALSLYVSTPQAPAGWQKQGCYTDQPSSRSLGVAMSVPGGIGNMTIEGCTSSCLAAGYTLAGVEYSRECYCASAGKNRGNFEGYEASTCNLLCTGNNLEICGGSDAIDVYSYSGTPQSNSSNLVQNPGFEQGFANWVGINDPVYGAGQDDTQPFELQITGGGSLIEHSGSSAAVFSGYNERGTQQTYKRGICAAQQIYITKAATYSLEFYLGSAATQPFTSAYQASFQGSLGSLSFTGKVCATDCTISSTNGKRVFNRYSYRALLDRGYQTLQICGEYQGYRTGTNQEEAIYLDDISLVASA